MTPRREWWLRAVVALVGVVALIAVLTTLLTKSGGAATGGSDTAGPLPTPSSSPLSASSPSATPKRATSSGGNPHQFFGVIPHQVKIVLVTQDRIYAGMSWKVPSNTSVQGKFSGILTQWSKTFTVYGGGAYVGYYVQFFGATHPVGCAVYVDGVLKVKKTATGRDNAVMCVA